MRMHHPVAMAFALLIGLTCSQPSQATSYKATLLAMQPPKNFGANAVQGDFQAGSIQGPSTGDQLHAALWNSGPTTLSICTRPDLKIALLWI